MKQDLEKNDSLPFLRDTNLDVESYQGARNADSHRTLQPSASCLTLSGHVCDMSINVQREKKNRIQFI
jgi:hypothetical protein